MAGGNANFGRMLRKQQEAADQRRNRNAHRRGLNKRAGGEALKIVLGNAPCVACGEELPRSLLLMTERGPCCDNCESPTVVHEYRWAEAGVLLAPIAVAGMLMIADPGTLFDAGLTLLFYFGPFLGPLAVIMGVADLRQLRALVDAAEPDPIPGYAPRRNRAFATTLAGVVVSGMAYTGWTLLYTMV